MLGCLLASELHFFMTQLRLFDIELLTTFLGPGFNLNVIIVARMIRHLPMSR